jgi:RNA polymerase sigma-70 factor, ECF subfamily
MQVERTNEAWVSGLRGADAAARDAVVADLRDYVRRTLAKGFGRRLDGADLDDLTQECVLRVHLKLDGFEGQCRFTTWATTVAINTALSELRRRRYQHVSIEEAGELAELTEPSSDGAGDDPRLALLRRGIAEALTDRQREAVLAALGGLPLTELARRYDVSQGAVYKLLHDARRRLKRYLEEAERMAALEGGPS